MENAKIIVSNLNDVQNKKANIHRSMIFSEINIMKLILGVLEKQMSLSLMDDTTTNKFFENKTNNLFWNLKIQSFSFAKLKNLNK